MSNSTPPDGPGLPGGAMEKLRSDARVDARMLKANQPITDAQRAAVIDEIKHYRRTHIKGGKPLSWKAIARHVGVAESVLNQVANGTYSGDVDGVVRRIDEFLSHEQEASSRPNIRELVITRLVEDMHAAVKQALLRRTIAVITAENGDGKTFMAQWLRDQHEGAVLITCKPGDCDRGFIVDKLFEALEIKTYCRFSRQKSREIEAYLQRHTNTVIIIDEAQQLTNCALEMLRAFHDSSDPEQRRNVPVILFGDQNFYKVILASRKGGRSPFSPQITSRMFPIYHAEAHGVQRDEDGDPLPEAVFTRADIERIVKQGRLRLFRGDALAFAVRLANYHNWGRLRLAVRVLETALDLKPKNAPQVTLGDMHNALSLCIPASEARVIVDAVASKTPAEPRVAVAGGA